MGRFGHKRVSSRQASLQLRQHLRRRKLERAERRKQWTRLQQAQWAALHDICPDRASRTRLAHLVNRMTGPDRGARESALAELELATLLIRAGFGVKLLPESQDKTADLECRLGDERLFLEVTALVGSTRRPVSGLGAHRRKVESEDDKESQHRLVSRLLARIAQKARQLAHYEAPVVLAATVPQGDPLEVPRDLPFEQGLDLKLLAGSVTLLLTRLRHLSAVLLSLWDIEPLLARSGVRLANVHVLERSRQQAAYPRVRMLILNPVAGHRLESEQITALKSLL